MVDRYNVHVTGSGVDFRMSVKWSDIESFIEVMTNNGMAVTILKGVTEEKE